MQLPAGDMGNKQAPEKEEEDQGLTQTSVPATTSAPRTTYSSQENGEEGEEELPPLPPPMKPINEPILVSSQGSSSGTEENPGKRVSFVQILYFNIFILLSIYHYGE